MTPHKLAPYAVLLGLLLLVGAPTGAQEEYDEQVAKGDYYFKAGYYLKASEHYRLALLEDPTSPDKKLAFGHSLFAIGNYSYASYALRRGVAQLDPDESFEAEIESLFASNRAFVQALRDLKRYVTYSPRDPAGLTVLGYVLYTVDGEEERCRDMFLYLQRLDRNDPFAGYFLEQLDRRDGHSREESQPAPWEEERSPRDVEPVEVEPDPIREPEPAAPVEPPPPDLREILPEPERLPERAQGEWPHPEAALSD
jgi:tetratricopeptide (TPR) repeat protein